MPTESANDVLLKFHVPRSMHAELLAAAEARELPFEAFITELLEVAVAEFRARSHSTRRRATR
jgi:hypothetical protein